MKPKFSSAKFISVAEIKITQSINLLELLNAHNIGINQSCGGFGTCTTCRIVVTKGADCFSARHEVESERAHERGFSENERLACQVQILAHPVMDVEIVIANSTEE